MYCHYTCIHVGSLESVLYTEVSLFRVSFIRGSTVWSGSNFFHTCVLAHWGTCSCRYDKKDTTKLQLVDMQMIGAMGPPGGGRNPITPRFLRHFNVISINEFSDETMSRIFSNIVSFQLKASP